MGSNESDLLDLLKASEWKEILGMPLQHCNHAVWDLAISIPDTQIVITGKAHSLPNGNEHFSLDIYQVQPGQSWKDQDGVSLSRIRDLKQELLDHSLGHLLKPPREIHLLTDPHISNLYQTECHTHEAICGIVFSQKFESGTASLALVTSTDFPCAIKITSECI